MTALYPDSPTIDERREKLLVTLGEISRQQDRLRYNRVRSIFEARDIGCTWNQIGEALGVTEGAARQVVNRAGDIA